MKKIQYVILIGLTIFVSVGSGIWAYGQGVIIEEREKFIEEANWAIPFTEEYANIVLEENNQFAGYKDRFDDSTRKILSYKGTLIPVKTDVDPSDEDFTLEETNSGSKIIDKNGNTKYSVDAGTYLQKIQGKYFEEQSGVSTKIIDASKGAVVKELENISGVLGIGEKLYRAGYNIIVKNQSAEIILDKDFKPAFGGKLYMQIGTFSEGLCFVEQFKNGNMEKNPTSLDFQSGYIDKTGKIKIPLEKTCLYATDFNDHKAIVYTKTKLKCIDKTGAVIYEKNLVRKLRDNEKVRNLDGYKYGHAVCYNGKHQGVIDDKGNWIVRPVFQYVSLAGQNMAIVSYGDKTGVVILQGGEDNVK